MNADFIDDNTEVLDEPKKGKYDENELLKICKRDYKLAESDQNAKIAEIIKYRNEYNGHAYGNEKDGKSRVVNRDIKKHASWLESALLDIFTSTENIVKCYPTTPRSTKFAQCAEIILNTQFCRQFNRFNFMSRAISTLLEDGICVVKTGWEFMEEEREVFYNVDIPLSMLGQQLQPEVPQEMLQQVSQQDPQQAQLLQLASQPMLDELGRQVYHHEEQSQREMVAVINQPTAILCRNEDIYIDPTCLGDMTKAQFIVHRYLIDIATLEMDGRYKNLDKIKPKELTSNQDIEDYHIPTDFEFGDRTRQKMLMYEYWGNLPASGDSDEIKPMVVCWIDDVVIRCEENPYPDKKPPFIVTPFLPKPFDVYGEPHGAILSENQFIKTAIYRGIIDSMANSNNGQIGVRKGALDNVNKERMLKGDNFEFVGDPGTAMFVGSFGNLPATTFNFLQLVDSESTQLTGVNTFGQNQTTNRIGQDNFSKGVLDGGNLRKLQIAKNIAENLVKPLLRKWLEYSAELLEDEQVFRITGGDHFEIIRRDDLYGSIDLDMAISTNEDNAIRTNQLAFLLQTIGPNEDPNIRKMIMAEIMKMHRMPELATRIETYEPQPDPLLVAQQQLMIEKLKAEIAELQANAGKIEQDGILKSAKAQAEGERAKQTKAQTDKINLDFIQQQRGQKEMADMAKLQEQLESQERIAKMSNDAMLANNIYKDMIARQEKANLEEKKALQKQQEEKKKKEESSSSESNRPKSKQEIAKQYLMKKSGNTHLSPKRTAHEPRNDVDYRKDGE